MTTKFRITAVIAGMVMASPVMAAALTPADQAYLNRVRPDSGIDYAQMDDQSQTKIHAAIHDRATAKNPKARGRAVGMLLDQYRHGWLWSLGRH